MKKNVTLLSIALLGMVAFFSCKKSDNNNNNHAMTATINSAAFKSPLCYAAISDSVMTITASSNSSTLAFPNISLVISNFSGAGTYTIGSINGGTFTTSAVIDSTDTSGIQSIYGTISITATSPNVVGTFSFTCSDSTKVTSGAFNAASPL
jgi:hypothetical protein